MMMMEKICYLRLVNIFTTSTSLKIHHKKFMFQHLFKENSEILKIAQHMFFYVNKTSLIERN